MTVGRPELVVTIASFGVTASRAETTTRAQMEAGIIPKIKGRKGTARASLQPAHGAAAILGISAELPNDAGHAYASLCILQAGFSTGGIVSDPVGRLLPSLMVDRADGDEEEEEGKAPITLGLFLTGLLTHVAALSPEETRNVRQSREAKSAYLEMNPYPATATFRWEVDGVEHQVRFDYPGTPLSEILDEEAPAYQVVTKIRFSLLFAVGRLFAEAREHRSVTSVPPSGNAPASADPESRNAAPARAASLGNWSRSNGTRKSDTGKVGGWGENLNPLPLRDRLLISNRRSEPRQNAHPE
jgi:hypothetical protein